MTEYVVALGLFRDNPVTIVDVGARWGYNPEWSVFGESLKIYCFEPDEAECARLNAAADPNVTYIPVALGKAGGEAAFYETRLGASSGLYKTNMDYFSRLLNRDNGEIVREHKIRVTTLEEALKLHTVRSIDFIKLDVEGAELDILLGAKPFIGGNDLLGILSEIRFQEEINGSPVFSEFDAHVRKFGFRLFGMQFSQQSRRALPYPGLGDYRLPTGEKFFAYTTHGQIMDGDALYFRDLLLPANTAIRAAADPVQILKAAAFFELYCLNDCAAELVLAHRTILSDRVNCDVLLDLLSPPLRRKHVGYKAYMQAYFDPNSSVVDAPPLTPKDIVRRLIPPRVRLLLRKLLGR